MLHSFLILGGAILCPNPDTQTCSYEENPDSLKYQSEQQLCLSITKSVTEATSITPTEIEKLSDFAIKSKDEGFKDTQVTSITSTTVSEIPPLQSIQGLEESFNYASFDCGALIRSSNKEAIHSTSILQNSKDAYMLNPCSADKFVEIEVCQSILVKEITLANFEFFSSQFKDFQVYGSSKLPPEWILLGNFTAKNARDRQHFVIKDPRIWSKHVKIQITSHYGAEFYCPLTSIQIFGTTMLDDPVILLPSRTAIPTSTLTKTETIATKEIIPTNSLCPKPQIFTTASTSRTIASKTVHTDTTATQIITPTPTHIQQKSVFAKIIHRIVHLEKGSIKLEDDLGSIQKENQEIIKHSTEKLESLIESLLVGLQAQIQASMDDLEAKKSGIDERLANVAQVLEDLKFQLSWAQFWNHIILFLVAICLKIVNDRLNLI